ncbi:MAG TPA: DUF4350 domain-containing protein [Planctomycetaceae bacterium]|jgi:hypothetical protein|nr:DUF4350 domain-containing protein [Planctomycetaceae bacterium]
MTRNARRKLWVPLAALVLVGLIAWWGTSASVGYRSPLTCCTFDPETGGGLGLALWARQLGLPLRNLQDPLWEAVANVESREGNCFLTAGNGPWSPWHEDLTREQWTEIEHWLVRGNSLIVITTDPSTLPKVFVDDLFHSAPPLAESAEKVKSRVEALTEKTHSEKKRSGKSDNEQTSEPSTRRDAEEEESLLFSHVVPPNPPTSLVSIPGQQSLTVRADGPRWTKISTPGESAADGKGVVWLRQPVGKGAVYVLLDDFAWTNAGFDGAGNADALAALLAKELREEPTRRGAVPGTEKRRGVFGFDEYRHGHGRVESFAAYLLKLPGGSAFLLIAFLLAGVYFLGRNVRFGPPEPYVLVERRTAREYVEAAAFLNQRARAAPLAVESVVRRLRGLALRRGHSNTEMDELLRQAERFVASSARPAKPSEVCGLVRNLIALRKKLYGS